MVIDYDKCIGCRSCLNACPYGSRTSDFGRYYVEGAAEGAPSGDNRPLDGPRSPYEHQPRNEYAENWNRDKKESPVGNARKCHFCLHRLEVGQLPMVCSAHLFYWVLCCLKYIALECRLVLGWLIGTVKHPVLPSDGEFPEIVPVIRKVERSELENSLSTFWGPAHA